MFSFCGYGAQFKNHFCDVVSDNKHKNGILMTRNFCVCVCARMRIVIKIIRSRDSESCQGWWGSFSIIQKIRVDGQDPYHERAKNDEPKCHKMKHKKKSFDYYQLLNFKFLKTFLGKKFH